MYSVALAGMVDGVVFMVKLPLIHCAPLEGNFLQSSFVRAALGLVWIPVISWSREIISEKPLCRY
jgi:hypothetical protein